MTLNVAICGIGRIGKIHYYNIKRLNKFYNIKFLLDTEVSEDFEEPIFHPNIMEEMLSKYKIDAIFVCSPTDYHYSCVKKALNLGIHAFVEKPLSTELNEIKELYQIAYEKKLVLFCGFNRRCDPEIVNLRMKYRRGDLGKAEQILIITRDYPYPKKEFIQKSSDFYSDCIIHDID